MTLPTGWRVAGPQFESGQSWVFCVRRDTSSHGHLYALKRLKNPERRERFVREVGVMDKLRREHGASVPEIIDSDLEVERPWFVMPWFGEGSLQAAVIDARFKNKPVDGLYRVTQLGETLSDVHAAGVAHRDLKPANVLLEARRLFLTDFGLCLDLEEPGFRLTQQNEAVGSWLYIAPENEGGINPELDQRPADFYAFGKLLWALLAGRPPLPREQMLESDFRLANLLENPKFLAVDDLLRDLLNRDPRARLTDWQVVIRELRAVDADLQGRPTLTTRPPTARALTLARRLRESSAIQTSLAIREQQQGQRAWVERLDRQLFERARTIEPSLAGLNHEFGDVLSILVSRSNPPPIAQLAASGVDVPSQLQQVSSPTYPASGSICFVINSQTGIRTLPTILVRVWPIVVGDYMWIASLPTVAPIGMPEEAVSHLAQSLASISGPLALLRQSSVEEALAKIEKIARLFVGLVDIYLEIVDSGGDPADPSAWLGKEPQLADVIELPAADRGDTRAPELRTFDFSPTVVALARGSVAIKCRARLVDDLSGIAGEGYTSSPSQARFRSPSGQIRDVMFDPQARISGDLHDGVYEATLTLPAQAERGFWVVEHVLVADQVGNAYSYSTVELRERGFGTRLEVR